MRIRYGLLFLFSLILGEVHSQTTYQILGKVVDKTREALPGANIVIINPATNRIIKGSTTNLIGDFTIKNVSPGNYTIKVSFMGYQTLVYSRKITNQSLYFGYIVMTEQVSSFKTFTVTAKSVPTEIKGDTTQYNAGSYQVNPDATAEDLVNKMPGITSSNGTVQAHGETVQQVYVDNKPFFGDDVNTVLKNLPAEVIDKVQVFDKKSDQSEFTGFDDGNSFKAMNIITKPSYHNGTFGKIYGGYGTDGKWNGGFSLNFFHEKRRITLLMNSNNINVQNFTTSDLMGVMGGGGTTGSSSGGYSGSRGSSGGGTYIPSGGSASNFLVNNQNGITTTNAFGANYTDNWKNVDFTGSYFFNNTNNDIISNTFRTYVANTSSEGMTYRENSNNQTKNSNNRVNMRIEWKIDSSNSFLFQPKISFQENIITSSVTGINYRLGKIEDSTNSHYNSNLFGSNISIPILYRHAFHKRGRTFSINLSPGYNSKDGNITLNSYSIYNTTKIDSFDTTLTSQLSKLNTQGYVLSSTMVYTEPLGTKSQLMFNWGGNYNKTNSDKSTYDYSQITKEYNHFDSTLSSIFNNEYLAQSLGTSYRYSQEKWNFAIGLSYQYAQLDNERIVPANFMLDKTFTSLLPNAMFQYKFTPKKNLRINFRSGNTAPTITQLQDVVDNTNPLQLSIGNPNLKQNYTNNLFIRYTGANTVKNTSFVFLLNAIYIHDYIAASTFTNFGTKNILFPISSKDSIPLASGSQLTMPVNLNNYYTVRSFANYSFNVDMIKSKLNFSGGATYTHTPGLINNEINYAYNTDLNAAVVLSSNISKEYDFTLYFNYDYNITSNTLEQLKGNYSVIVPKLRFQIMPWKGLVLQSDISYQFTNGLSAGYNQNYILWNAAIGYKFLKNQKGEFRLSAYDILNQNKSLTRSVTGTYYQDVSTNVLKQYFLLTFTYNLRTFNGPMPQDLRIRPPRGNEGMPPPTGN